MAAGTKEKRPNRISAILGRLPWWREKHPLIARNHAAFKGFDQRRPLTEYRFVVLDTELTGLDRKKDEIVAIGAVRIDRLQIDLGQTFHSYVRPERLTHTEATLVHRITPGQLRQAPTLAEVLPEFLAFIGEDLLVGHFVGLDMGFLQRAVARLYQGTLVTPCIDTMRLAQGYKEVQLGYYQEMQLVSNSYRLSDLSREFQLPLFEAHDALEDALQTAYLFLYLVKKFRKGGLITLHDLYRAGRSAMWKVH
jgi:DNA polymerase III subunit epsilon